MTQYNGGAAFPHDEIHDPETPNRHLLASTGMSLRDYFAAKAMQGFCAGDALEGVAKESVQKAVSEIAYQLADAMLVASK